ncbi:MAG: toll/interleukin-1 receptor domain-containing protein, partial [Limisphaerales bacterium]
MNGDQQEKNPKVFISYSHDNAPHKAWVAELATKLRENGIDVRFDRWDLRRGEDVAKFMEQSVTWADRVLMICTDAYVRKADEGKGGVGYEAMIVTGELIKDLGTAKFIPIIRQDSGKTDVPKFMGTRFYVNLSEGQNINESFEELLRELHNEPALKKPPLGKNPFAKTPAGNESHVVTPASNPLPSEIVFNDSSEIYQAALEIARLGDLVAWRRLTKQAKASITTDLSEWRKRWEAKRGEGGGLLITELPAMCIEGLSAYSSLMCVALAGVESGREAFNNQTGVLDEIMFPKDWQGSGLTVLAEFPDTAAFVYQAIHGALCMETDQLQLAIRLATTRIQRPYESESHRLFENHELIGWPKSLNGSCTAGWSLLLELSEKLPWLKKIFGDADSYKAALYAYYLALNYYEFVDVLAAGREEDLKKDEFWTTVPICSAGMSEQQNRQAYRLLTRKPEAMHAIWEKRGVPNSKLLTSWPLWIQHTQNMRSKLGYRFASYNSPTAQKFD